MLFKIAHVFMCYFCFFNYALFFFCALFFTLLLDDCILVLLLTLLVCVFLLYFRLVLFLPALLNLGLFFLVFLIRLCVLCFYLPKFFCCSSYSVFWIYYILCKFYCTFIYWYTSHIDNPHTNTFCLIVFAWGLYYTLFYISIFSNIIFK